MPGRRNLYPPSPSLSRGVPRARRRAPPAGWAPDVAAASAYAQQRQGIVTFHVRTERGRWSRDADRTVPSASVVKAMLMVAYLNRADVRGRALTAADHALLDPMIRRSEQPRGHPRARHRGQRRAHPAGRARRHVPVRGAPDLGPLADQRARPDAAVAALRVLRAGAPPRHRAAAAPDDRPEAALGLRRVPLPAGWVLRFKGGWGSGTGLVEHQVALLTRGDERVAIAILTTGSPSHRYGKRTLRGLAERLLRGLPG